MLTSFFSKIAHFALLLVESSTLLTVLIIVGVFFIILIILGMRKTYKLNVENRRLNELHKQQVEKEEKYQDFTEGHLYDNNNK